MSRTWSSDLDRKTTTRLALDNPDIFWGTPNPDVPPVITRKVDGTHARRPVRNSMSLAELLDSIR